MQAELGMARSANPVLGPGCKESGNPVQTRLSLQAGSGTLEMALRGVRLREGCERTHVS